MAEFPTTERVFMNAPANPTTRNALTAQFLAPEAVQTAGQQEQIKVAQSSLFDFLSEGEYLPQQHVQGFWSNPEFTRIEYLEIFTKAREAIATLEDRPKSLFGRAIDEAFENYLKQGDGSETQGAYGLWNSSVTVDKKSVSWFISLCFSMISDEPISGIEYKSRINHSSNMTESAMYVQGAGTLVVREWGRETASFEFVPFYSPVMLDSYTDGAISKYVPFSEFSAAYCADKLGESGNGIAAVPTFVCDGREYVCTGTFSTGNGFAGCSAWSVHPLFDWPGLTYSYRSQAVAVDGGCIQRGNRRGLIVRIRGQLVVLDTYFHVYDDRVKKADPVKVDIEGEGYKYLPDILLVQGISARMEF